MRRNQLNTIVMQSPGHRFHKIFSLISGLSLICNSLFPVGLIPLLIATPAVAATSESTDLTFNPETSNFTLNVHAPSDNEPVDYLLSYFKTSTQTIEGVSGNGTTQFSRDILAGTCSGSVCVPHSFNRVLTKVVIDAGSTKWCEAEQYDYNGSLVTKNETVTACSDAKDFTSLTDAESSWLQTGTNAIPTPTPTPEQGQILNGISTESATPTPTPTSTPTPTPTVEPLPTPKVMGHLEAAVLKNAKALSLNLGSTNIVGSAVLTTNQPDYAPTDTVVITGSDFIPIRPYKLFISSTDPPAVDFQTEIRTNATGDFIYSYQLDGNYRPDYSVVVKNDDAIIASTTFTDKAINFPYDCSYQCSANDITVQKVELVKDLSGTPLTCSAGQLTTTYIKITYNNHSTDRYATYLTGDIYEGGNLKQSINWSTTCLDHIATGTDSKIIPTGYSWTCGSSIAIKNIKLSWDTGVNTCSDFGSKAKCNSPGQSWCNSGVDYIVTTPLVADFSADSVCLGSPTHFTDKTSGGTTPYSYSWAFGDGGTSTTSSPTHTYSTAGTFSTKLSVTDSSSPIQTNDITHDVTVNLCSGTLNVIKQVTNDNGGTKGAGDFTINVSGGTPSSFPGSVSGTTVTVPADGSYNVTEGSHTGYSVGYSADCNGTMPAGRTKTCTVTNDDIAPKLKVDKSVVPSDTSKYQLQIDGSTFGYNIGDGGSTGYITVSVGQHSVGELAEAGTNLSDYIATYGGYCDSTGHTTLSVGDQKTCVITNTKKPKLTVTKVLSPSTDPGKFNLSINGTPYATDVVNGGTTGAHYANIGSNTFTEAAGTSTDLSDYTSVISGTGCGGTSTAGTITLAAGDNKTCTITNTRQTGYLKVVKHVVGTDSASNWEMHIVNNGTDVTSFAGAEDPGLTTKLVQGTYRVVEYGGVANYSLSYSGCDNNGYITVTAGQTATCTLTNTRDTGTIELKKVWSGTGGQTTLNIGTTTGGSQIDTQQTGSNGTVPLTTGPNTVNTGTYYLSETGGLTNYTPSGLICFNDTNNNGSNDNESSVTVGANDSVAVASGQHIICSYTNTRKQGSISFDKIVIGGTAKDSDWTFTISGQGTAKDGDTKTYDTGSYTVTESGASDYTLTGASGVCSMNPTTKVMTLTVDTNGGTCTVTNTRDTGIIIAQKVVDDGSNLTQWSFSLDGGSPVQANAQGVVNFGQVTTGPHHITESGPTSYTLSSITGDCNENPHITGQADASVIKDGTKTCVFTNVVKKGSLTVIKNAVPDDPQDFSFTATGNGVSNFSLDDDSDPTLSNTKTFSNLFPGTYALSESTVAGWDKTSAICSDGSPINAIVIDPGENVTCTFTNTKLTKIIIRKQATPTGSGTNETFNFDWAPLGGNSSTPFSLSEGQQPYDTGFIPAGTYTITEPTVPTGWEDGHGIASCDNGQTSDRLTLNPGDVVTCTFMNYKQGSISGTKFNDLNANGVKDAGEPGIAGWQIYVDTGHNNWTTTTDSNGNYSFPNLRNQNYSICETEQTGWVRSYPTDSNCQTVTVANGANSVADFGNYQNAHLTVTKNIIDPNGNPVVSGDTTSFAFSAAGNTFHLTNGQNQSFDLKPGNYTVVETPDAAYLSQGCTNLGHAGTITLTSGQNVTVTCTNQQKTGHIIVGKSVLNPNGGEVTDTSTNFTFAVAGQTTELTDGQSHDFELNPGAYDVVETPNANYTFNRCQTTYEPSGDITNGIHVVLASDQTATVTCQNLQKKGSVIVTKFNDRNGNGSRDTGEEVLNGWTINLTGQDSQITGAGQNEEGKVMFQNLIPSDYFLSESMAGNEGWEQTGISCSTDQKQTLELQTTNIFGIPMVYAQEQTGHLVPVGPGAAVTCEIGNRALTPILHITKSNNAGGDKSPGDSVQFTLTVSLDENGGPANNVQVTDLPAGGFVYRPGSWSATKNGDPFTLDEPTYHSPGVWTIGGMQPGDTVILSYTADISGSEQAGLYKDIAYASGKDLLSNTVYANNSDDPQYYVGTEVNVVGTVQNGISHNVINTVTGQVLGASTELPATGASAFWLYIAFGLVTGGISIGALGWFLRRKYA